MTVSFETLLLALLLIVAAFYLIRSLRCFVTTLKTGKSSCPDCACARKHEKNLSQ